MQGWTVDKEKWRLNSERGALVGTACECDWLRTGREEQLRAGGQGGQVGWRTPEEEITEYSKSRACMLRQEETRVFECYDHGKRFKHSECVGSMCHGYCSNKGRTGNAKEKTRGNLVKQGKDLKSRPMSLIDKGDIIVSFLLL